MTNKLDELAEEAKGDLKDWMLDNPGDDPDDAIFEIADQSVPVYTGNIIDLACEEHSLFFDEPELGPAFDGKPTPVNIVAANIFEYVYRELHEYKDALKEELDHLEEELSYAEDEILGWGSWEGEHVNDALEEIFNNFDTFSFLDDDYLWERLNEFYKEIVARFTARPGPVRGTREVDERADSGATEDHA